VSYSSSLLPYFDESPLPVQPLFLLVSQVTPPESCGATKNTKRLHRYFTSVHSMNSIYKGEHGVSLFHVVFFSFLFFADDDCVQTNLVAL
jgi:hypothetical protein